MSPPAGHLLIAFVTGVGGDGGGGGPSGPDFSKFVKTATFLQYQLKLNSLFLVAR